MVVRDPTQQPVLTQERSSTPAPLVVILLAAILTVYPTITPLWYTLELQPGPVHLVCLTELEMSEALGKYGSDQLVLELLERDLSLLPEDLQCIILFKIGWFRLKF